MRFFVLHIILFFFILPTASAQLSQSAIKSNFVLNMAKFVEWEREDTIDKYMIGVLGPDEIYEELLKKTGYIPFKDKRFDVVKFKKINEIRDVHVLYVEKRRNHIVEKILDIATQQSILMFSDSCLNRDIVMINLLDMNDPDNRFEINKDNAEKAGLYVPPKLLFYGGSEEDLREIYQASERELSNVQEELERQTDSLKQQQQELEAKKQEIFALNDEIVSQKEHLKTMISEVEAKQDSLDLKIELLEAQKIKIREQQSDIEKQNDQLFSQKQEIEAGNDFLNRQKLEIEKQEQKITKQQNEIQNQTETLASQTSEIQAQTLTIEKQQTILYFFIVFFALVAAMIFFILRAYRIKRQANKKLEEKNIAISKQKEEIQSQQAQLQVINRKIEKQNENIKSSIHYALTIQQALLPSKKEMDQLFDHFIVYRPRDIVSGDFYWLNSVVSEKGTVDKIFVAVADCTGHGVPGAFLSMIGIKLLNSIVNERKQYDPRIILEMLNIAVQEALKQEKKVSDDGMDMCLCCLEKTNKNQVKVSYSGARRPLYYSSGKKIKTLPGDRKTVGGRFYKNQVFTNKELILDPGDRIYLSSDGIADQNAPNRQKFGSKRLIKLLEESLHLPMAGQKQNLEKNARCFPTKGKATG